MISTPVPPFRSNNFCARIVLAASACFGAMLTVTDSMGQDRSADATKIGELNEAYVVAFNEGDAKKVASLFSAEGDFTLLTGDAIAGRGAIMAAHVAFFKNNPNAKISGKQVTRRFIGQDVCIATGTWKVENGPAVFPSAGAWSTVVARQDGKWRYEAMRLMVPVGPSRP